MEQSLTQVLNLANCQQGVEAAGLQIERTQGWAGKTTFADLGALVYFLHAAP